MVKTVPTGERTKPLKLLNELSWSRPSELFFSSGDSSFQLRTLYSLLLAAEVDQGPAPGGLCVLPAHTDPPVVPETTVEPDLLHALRVLTEAGVEQVRVLLTRLPVLDVALPVQHPGGDTVLDRVRDHRHDLVDLVRGELPGALVQVDVALLAHEVREPAADALDGGEREHDLLPPIDVRVAHTQDMLEVLRLELERHDAQNRLVLACLDSGGSGVRLPSASS